MILEDADGNDIAFVHSITFSMSTVETMPGNTLAQTFDKIPSLC